MEPEADAIKQENLGGDEPPMQPPVQGLPPNPNDPNPNPNPIPNPNPNPARREFFPRPYHGKAARHRKPVVTQMCEICNIELIGQVVIDAHMKGSKHAKKLKARELLSQLIYKCEICSVALNSSQQLEVHNAGAKHIAKAKEIAESGVQDGAAPENNAPNADVANDAQKPPVQAENLKPGVNPQELSCTVCNINVNSPQQLEQHLASKKHKDRESGRISQRPAPYQRAGYAGRGGRGGLGSQGHCPPARGGGGGGKAASGKYASLSASFKSAGYSNSFIKPEGGVILPSNCGTNRGPNESHPQNAPSGNRGYNTGGQFKNRGNFGSLTPYVSTDTARGGFNARGGAAVSQAAWTNPGPVYGGYGYDYGYAGYNYSGYETGEGYTEGYVNYGMMQPIPTGPPPPPPPY